MQQNGVVYSITSSARIFVAHDADTRRSRMTAPLVIARVLQTALSHQWPFSEGALPGVTDTGTLLGIARANCSTKNIKSTHADTNQLSRPIYQPTLKRAPPYSGKNGIKHHCGESPTEPQIQVARLSHYKQNEDNT